MKLKTSKYYHILENLPYAFAYHRIVTGDNGNPVDYVFLEVNTAFEEMTGLKRENILGRKVTEVLPGIEKAEFDWIGIYGRVALEGTKLNFEQYSEPLKRWYDVQAYSEEPGYFTTVFSEITARKHEAASMQKLLKLTERMLVTDTADLNYQEIAETLRQLSGAKFAAINTYEDDRIKTVTRAISGFSSMIESASKLLGFKIAGQAWDIIPERLRKIEGGKLVRFNSLYETAMGSLSKTTSAMLHELAGIGDIYVIELVFGGQETLGDVIFFLPKNKDIENREAIELYARQLGTVLGRLRVEEKLLKNKKRLSLAQINARAGYWEYDIKEERLYWSKECEALFGLNEGEFEGTFDAFLNQVHPDDKEYVLAMNRPIIESKKGIPLEFEHRIIKKDGTVIWVRETADTAYDKTGEAAFIAGFVMDITERKKSEEELEASEARLNQFFSQSLTGFFFMMLDEPVTWDETTDKEKALDYVFHYQRMTRVNQAMLDQYGATEEDFIGKTPYELFKHDLEHGRYIWRGLFDQGRWHVETDERRMDGTPIIINGDYICLYDNEGRITGHFGVQVDITEQKQTEEELFMQRERLSNIVEGANVATWEWNVQTGELIINERWAEMIGYKLEDVHTGHIKTWLEFTHPADLEMSNQKLEQHFSGELAFYDVECRRKHKYGHWIWVNDRGTVISWTEDGKPLWVFGTLIDINERKKIEEALKTREKQYRSVVDDLTEMVCRFTPEGVLTFVSHTYCHFMGKEEDELVGSNFLEALPDEDRSNIIKQYSNLSPQNPVVTYEHRVVFPSGEIAWQQWIDRAIYDEQGKVVEMQGVGRDITVQKKAEAALQESEKRYREILETTAEGFYEVDLKGKFVACNRAAAEMLGYREEEIVGMNYKSLCKDPDAVFREFNQAFTRGKSKFNIVMEMIRKDGTVAIADISASLTYDQQGHINGFRGMGRDVTEKVKMEEHLKYVSLHDELTGLYNRRYFENELARLDSSREHPVTVISADLDGLKLINDTLGHSEGDRYLQAGSKLLKNSLRGSDILARVGGDEFALLLPHTSQEAAEELAARIRRQIDEHNSRKGTLPLSISIGLAVNKEGKQPLEETYKQADAAMYRDKLTRSKQARSAIVSSLLASLSERSDLGEGAAELVPELCIQLAQAIKLDDGRMANLQLLAQVYDLGKVNMPDHIIHSSLTRKTGELTEEDREAIRSHPEAGYRIASASPELAEVADLILKHHENYDGSGYPLGLKGEEIPLECRILAIACAYSAMISPRAYAQIRSKTDALAELKRCSGSQFDPRLVNIFSQIIEEQQQKW